MDGSEALSGGHDRRGMGATRAARSAGGAWRTTTIRADARCGRLFCVLRGGIAWRLVPHDFPPWRTVYHYFRIWRIGGVLRWNAVTYGRLPISASLTIHTWIEVVPLSLASVA